MDTTDLQETYLMEKMMDPASREFREMMQLLIQQPTDGRTRQDKLAGKGEFRYVLPCRGDGTSERWVMDNTPFTFAERSFYRNGIVSLSLVMSELLDLAVLASGRKRQSATLVVSAEVDTLQAAMLSSGNVAPFLHFIGYDNVADALAAVQPETVIFDHTTINCPLDKLLNLCYRAGVQIVDGFFPHHAAALRGADVVAGHAKWSYSFTTTHLTVGPDDDPSRLLRYGRKDYRKFMEPSLWEGKSRTYGYEIRGYRHGLAVYRAVYLGTDADAPVNTESFKLPLCSSDDAVLVVINKDLASGVFSSSASSARALVSLEKNYCIEVRRELVVSCVDYLIAQQKGTDIVGEAVRYINQHNYVDLVDGVRLIRCPSLGYVDALCVSIVCALTAYSLRYRLTAESLPDVQRSVSAAKYLTNPPFGALGRLAWLLGTYVADSVGSVAARAEERALHKLYNSDYIPGICYDLYMDVNYVPDSEWFVGSQLRPEAFVDPGPYDPDPFTRFIGESEKTGAPSQFRDTSGTEVASMVHTKSQPYVANLVQDPITVLQHVYDQAFPGNSTAQVQNAAELRRIKPVNINTEFYGRVEINKDVAAPEKLHRDASLRTTALPVSKTPLLDAIIASAKRNFNPPDIQQQSNVEEYSRHLVDRFEEHCFVPGYRHILTSYKREPLTFNVVDYLDWLSGKDGNYRKALMADCPEELVELGLEKFDTIVKRRIKPKMSTAAQHELSQPQVIVKMSKKDNALFTSLFRVIFQRLEAILRPEFKSAGRASDADLTDWLTEHKAALTALTAVELDSSKYDKSQNLLARLIESTLFADLGLDPQVSKIYEDSYVGRVSSKTLGLVFVLAYQMKSGAPDTMIGNSIYNKVSAGESLGWRNTMYSVFKGDDNIEWVRAVASPDTVVAKMSGLFNLEVKMVMKNVLYFSSAYVVPSGDKLWFVPDPLKIVELLGERGADEKTLKERYVSFCDRIASLVADTGLPEALQLVMRRRLEVPDLQVVSMVDALVALTSSFEQYREAASL